MSGHFTHHGGALAAAARHYGGNAADWLDLSTGINPAPWRGRVQIDWHRLPDHQALLDLEAAAARHFGAPADLCCAVPGSEMALRLLGMLLGEARAAYRWPAYRTHAAAFHGAMPIREELPAHRRLLLLANPNNPDGRIIPAPDLQAWHQALAARDGWLVVDEAFADATPELSVAPQIGLWRRLIVLRSFGKFFGLAGCRLGFVLGPPEIIAPLRQLLGDWPLSAGALAAGQAAYGDAGWIGRARRDLAGRAAHMDDLLSAHGWAAKGACPHFRLIADDRAPRLFAHLARHRILTRPFDYDPRWLRLGIPGRKADWARLAEALRDG